jgi:hypothetical protein
MVVASWSSCLPAAVPAAVRLTAVRLTAVRLTAVRLTVGHLTAGHLTAGGHLTGRRLTSWLRVRRPPDGHLVVPAGRPPAADRHFVTLQPITYRATVTKWLPVARFGTFSRAGARADVQLWR